MLAVVFEMASAFVLYDNYWNEEYEAGLFGLGMLIQVIAFFVWIYIQGMIVNRDQPDLPKEPLSCENQEQEMENEM